MPSHAYHALSDADIAAPVGYLRSLVPVMPEAMPWPSYAGMADADLLAIFSYLRSLPPISNN